MNIFDELAAAKNADEVKAIAREFAAKKGSNADSIAKVADTMFGGSGQFPNGSHAPDMPGTKKLGREVSPLFVPEAELKSLFSASKSMQNYATKAPASVTNPNLLPPQLQSDIVSPVYDVRIADHIPAISISTPTYRYLKQNGAATGSPAPVAEAGAKPELVYSFENVDVAAIKIAAFVQATHESIQDFEPFVSYLTNDLFMRIKQTETDQILNQTGTSGNMDGLYNQAGLSLARPSDLTLNSIDAVSAGIAQMRSGSELCEPDFIIVNPTDFGKVRRLKDSLGRYLLGEADGSHDATNSIWGLPVLQSTQNPAGSALLVQRGFGYLLVREGLVLKTDAYSAATNNITKYIAELREVLAVERPNRLLKISNWATDASDVAPSG
jgi:HK97 family phage major capsid protein